MAYLLELNNITKKFGALVANDNVTVRVREGSVHSIVGENGAGKSTLMNVLYGLLKPDSGDIIFEGKKVSFSSPLDSIAIGLGMIHQHFMLVPIMTVLDNIILGYETGSCKLDRKASKEALKPLMNGFSLDSAVLDSKLGDLPVGIQQKIEIIKALFRKAKLIVFDEPTAVLTPQEIEEFFVLVRKLKAEGKTIIFISHKLNEIMDISDEITVMRNGKMVALVNRDEIKEESLAKLMIGRELSEQKVAFKQNKNNIVIEAVNLTTEVKLGSHPLKSLSFQVKQGEIYGIAGVAGNGQTELVNILVGAMLNYTGEVIVNGKNVTRIPSHKRKESMAYIPEDRQMDGLVMPFSIRENLLLGKVDLKKFINKRIFLNFEAIAQNANNAIKEYSIKASSINEKTESLSGGNQQKVIVARELNDEPDIILAVNPTRGIDIGSIEYIHSCLLAEREKGKTILLVSNELTEILALSDRIGIIHDGQIVKILENMGVPKEQIGFYMLGGQDENNVRAEAIHS